MQAKLPPPWQAVFDEDSGLYYFWNEDTDEVTWQNPTERVCEIENRCDRIHALLALAVAFAEVCVCPYYFLAVFAVVCLLAVLL